jgi:hypothetical protein
LQFCSIDPSLVFCIAEVSEEKFGASARQLAIRSLRKLRRAMEPDYFLVLPWHFAADHPT